MHSLKVGTRVLLLGTVFLVCLVVLSALGLKSMRTSVAGLETLYAERMVAVRDLKVVAETFAVDIVHASYKANSSLMTTSAAKAHVEAAEQRIAQTMQAYLNTTKGPEEAAQAEEIQRMVTAAGEPIERLKTLLANDDYFSLNQFMVKTLHPVIDPISLKVSELIELQLNAAREEYEAARQRYERDFVLMLGGGALAVLLGGGLSLAIRRSILTQLGAEPSALAQSAAEVSAGRLGNAQDDGAQAVGVMASIRTMRSNLIEVIRSISHTSGNIDQKASRLAQSAESALRSTVQQSEASRLMSGAMSELEVSIAHIADSASEVRTAADQARVAGESGLAVIGDTIADMDRIEAVIDHSAQNMARLNEQSQRIGVIVKVIRDIADQTNLLALNAAIEAARAGSQGAGFAVVADEVRKLAERTAVSAAEIVGVVADIHGRMDATSEQIADACRQVSSGKARAADAGEAMQQIQAAIGATLHSVGSIAEALQEQRHTSQAVAERVQDVSTAVEQLTGTQQEVGEAAAALKQLTHDLNRSVARFELS